MAYPLLVANAPFLAKQPLHGKRNRATNLSMKLGSTSLLLALTCGLSACGTSAPKTAVPATPAKVVVAAPPIAGHPAAAPPVSTHFQPPRLLKFISKSRSLLVHIEWEKVKKSALYPLFDKFLLSKEGIKAEAFIRTCHFDPVEVLQSVTIAIKDSDSIDNLLFVVRGNLTKDRLLRCYTDLGKKNKIAALQNTFWPEDGVLLAQDATTAAALESEADDGNLFENAAILSQLQTIADPNTALWAVGVLDEKTRKLFSPNGMGVSAPTQFVLSLRLEEDFDLHCTIDFEDASQASAAKKLIENFFPMMRSEPAAIALLDQTTLSLRDRQLSIDILLSRTQTEDFVSLLLN